jgi:hypothetical protein
MNFWVFKGLLIFFPSRCRLDLLYLNHQLELSQNQSYLYLILSYLVCRHNMSIAKSMINLHN